jgi:hypothetical protein
MCAQAGPREECHPTTVNLERIASAFHETTRQPLGLSDHIYKRVMALKIRKKKLKIKKKYEPRRLCRR